ncbi:hypothetical protein TMatcc_010556 [Talaromyces marneffei ATCC 18224]|uniref:Uncharacterized protein n=2 Tax=Talaromyces marneffei TaxID=37727 RepID=B6QV48_TALMQ|nr:hypothetical protein PMAA_011760 [Talaromyces marneffei ATCC 18224]
MAPDNGTCGVYTDTAPVALINTIGSQLYFPIPEGILNYIEENLYPYYVESSRSMVNGITPTETSWTLARD